MLVMDKTLAEANKENDFGRLKEATPSSESQETHVRHTPGMSERIDCCLALERAERPS